MRRRPILVASDVLRAVVLVTIPIAALLGVLSVSQLVVTSLLLGLGRVFFDVGYRSYLPAVIGRDRVLSGNASLELVRASGQVVGPGLGGALVSVVSAANVMLIQAVTFAVSALTLLGVRAPEPLPDLVTARPRLGPQIIDGLRLVWRNRLLRATAAARVRPATCPSRWPPRSPSCSCHAPSRCPRRRSGWFSRARRAPSCSAPGSPPRSPTPSARHA
jgi:MFS family permease